MSSWQDLFPPAAHMSPCQSCAGCLCRVTELRPRSTASQLAEFFEQWATQPRYALALHTVSEDEIASAAAAAGGIGSLAVSVGGKLVRPGSVTAGGEAAAGTAGAAGELRQRLQGIAVCWDLQQAFFLELSGGMQLATGLWRACCDKSTPL